MGTGVGQLGVFVEGERLCGSSEVALTGRVCLHGNPSSPAPLLQCGLCPAEFEAKQIG